MAKFAVNWRPGAIRKRHRSDLRTLSLAPNTRAPKQDEKRRQLREIQKQNTRQDKREPSTWRYVNVSSVVATISKRLALLLSVLSSCSSQNNKIRSLRILSHTPWLPLCPPLLLQSLLLLFLRSPRYLLLRRHLLLLPFLEDDPGR